jgi:hypothetical protein
MHSTRGSSRARDAQAGEAGMSSEVGRLTKFEFRVIERNSASFQPPGAIRAPADSPGDALPGNMRYEVHYSIFVEVLSRETQFMSFLRWVLVLPPLSLPARILNLRPQFVVFFADTQCFDCLPVSLQLSSFCSSVQGESRGVSNSKFSKCYFVYLLYCKCHMFGGSTLRF